MIDAFEKLTEIGIPTVGIVLLAVIVFLPMLVESWKKFLTTVTHHQKVEEHQQAQIDDVEAKIQSCEHKLLDKQELYHQQSIDIRNDLIDNQHKLEDDNKTLREAIVNLTKKLEDYIELDRETSVASLRYELYGMHKEFMKQKYVTTEGMKTFMELSDIYEKKGGDDILHDRLKPDILKLPIKYTDDLI